MLIGYKGFIKVFFSPLMFVTLFHKLSTFIYLLNLVSQKNTRTHVEALSNEYISEIKLNAILSTFDRYKLCENVNYKIGYR